MIRFELRESEKLQDSYCSATRNHSNHIIINIILFIKVLRWLIIAESNMWEELCAKVTCFNGVISTRVNDEQHTTFARSIKPPVTDLLMVDYSLHRAPFLAPDVT